MKTVLFIIFPAISHYTICFGLADKLRKEGYRVVFAGTKNMQEHIKAQQFEFIELLYMQEIIINSWRVALGLFIASALEKKFVKARYREFLLSAGFIQQVCKEVNPDVIHIDEHLNYYYWLLKPTYSNCSLVNTKLPTHRVPGIPPLTCAVPFKNNSLYKMYAWWLWERYISIRKLKVLFQRFIFCGIDDEYFFNRFEKKMNVSQEVFIHQANLLHIGIKGVPIIHLVPRNMEYSWYTMEPNESFFYQPYQREEKKDYSVFWGQLKPLLAQREMGKIQLVYASLGTLSESNAKPATKFLNKLISAFESLPNVHLILADNNIVANKNQRISNNVHVFNWVPQTALLPYCDAMITHGGTNSILECVQAGVPIVAYPLNLSADHPGNAARVVANRWGLQGNLRQETPAGIRRKITTLLVTSFLSKQPKIGPIIDGQQLTDLAESR